MKLRTAIYKVCCYVLFVTLMSFEVSAQDSLGQISLTFVPQYNAIHGFRIDLEKCFSKFSLVVSPQVYSKAAGNIQNRDNLLTDDQDKLSGYGVDVILKKYRPRRSESRVAYLGLGSSLFMVDVNFNYEVWVPVLHNGLQQYTFSSSDETEAFKITKFYGLYGWVLTLDNLIVEFYAGTGLKFSFYDSPAPTSRIREEEITDFGYNGLYPILGLKIGVLF